MSSLWPTFAICLSLKVFFQNSWRLQMLSLYIKVMLPYCSTTTDLYLYYVFCQRSLKRLCITRLQLFLRYLKFCMVINMVFRKKSSTHVALLTFINKVIQAIENGEYAIGVFLDFSKAFDTVDHKILLDKLDHYGIRGCDLSWFRSYLSHRLQYVTYNGSRSSQQLIKCGVPQGLF